MWNVYKKLVGVVRFVRGSMAGLRFQIWQRALQLPKRWISTVRLGSRLHSGEEELGS